MLGYTAPSDLLGRDLSDIVAPADRDMVMSRGARRMKGEQPPDIYEFEMIGLDRSHAVQVRSVPVLFEGASAVLTIVRDISELKETA
jgi:PAS domain S-box-containing protein